VGREPRSCWLQMTVRLGVELGITEKSVYLEDDEDSENVEDQRGPGLENTL
jgi:hypothetical protein